MEATTNDSSSACGQSELTDWLCGSPYDLVRCPSCGHEAPHHYYGCSEAR